MLIAAGNQKSTFGFLQVYMPQVLNSKLRSENKFKVNHFKEQLFSSLLPKEKRPSNQTTMPYTPPIEFSQYKAEDPLR